MNFDTITDWNQTNEAIAKQFGCCERTVRNARRARGLPRAPDKARRSILREQLLQIGLRGWRTYSNREIAYILKCSIAAVHLFRTTNNKPTRDLQLKVASKTNDNHTTN